MSNGFRALGNLMVFTVYCLGVGFVCGRIYQGVKDALVEKKEETKDNG